MQETPGQERENRDSVLSWEDICVSCGAPVPEGRMICWQCEHRYDKDEMAAFRPQRAEASRKAGTEENSRRGKTISLKNWLTRAGRHRKKDPENP